MSPRRSPEPLAQRPLALALREAFATHNRDAALDLILAHPVGIRSSHVRHNLSASHQAMLDDLIGEAALLSLSTEGR